MARLATEACCGSYRTTDGTGATPRTHEGKVREGARISGARLMKHFEFSQHRDLEREGADLASALDGTWTSGAAMCRCPAHADRTPSLSIRIGHSTLLFKCFAGCSTHDVIEAIRALRHTIPRAGTPSTSSSPGSVSQLRGLAEQIWSAARPLSGSPAEAYLRSRSISAHSSQLRYHPAAPHGRGAAVRFDPALIAAVRTGRTLVAIQRIFLGANSGTPAAQAKLTLGRPLRGAVTLSSAGETLGLAEGVETALSASMLLGIPVWAVLGNNRLSRVDIPTFVRRLVLLADDDRAGRLAAMAARQHFARVGRHVEMLWPWGGHNDWNDVLRAGGKRVDERTRRTA